MEEYDELWDVLADLVLILQRKVGIPKEIIRDLKSAKTMIGIYRADSTNSDIISRIEKYLVNVESYVITSAEADLGKEFAEECLKKLLQIRGRIRKKVESGHEKMEQPVSTKFVSGVPRDKHWIRIRITEYLPKDYLTNMTERLGLSHRIQENGFLLIYGNGENIKILVKKIAKMMRKKVNN